jgi:hypothetical protein
MDPSTRKIMVVCSDFDDNLATDSARDGWRLIWVYDGKTAISKARRENFDMIVLLSTGKEMDATETLLNLRDVRESMRIIVVTEPQEGEMGLGPNLTLPNAKIVSVEGLGNLIESLKEEFPNQEKASGKQYNKREGIRL